jgi:hypothetical protein
VAFDAPAFYRDATAEVSPLWKSDFMKIGRAFAAFAWCGGALWAGVPTTAAAQNSFEVEIGYAITYLGFTGFRIDFAGRFDGSSYDADSHTFKEGLIKAVTINYEGRNRASGHYGPAGMVPSGGSLSIVVGRDPRTWLAQYAPDGTISEKHTPPWKPLPNQVIPDKDRNGSLDPLNAAISVGMKGPAVCNQTVPSNDGKRRIDVILKKVGTESAATAGVPTARGDLVVCEIYTKRVSGQFDDESQESEGEAKRDAPMKVWFARLGDSPFVYPARLEAKQTIGTIHGDLTYFRERPLTDAEKAAMPH